MPKYVVTGGADGQSGVNVNGKRYEPGDTVDVANPKNLWLIKEGYLELASKAAPPVAAKATPAKDEEGD